MSVFDINKGSFCYLVHLVDIWLKSFVMFGLSSLIFIQLSFSFLKFSETFITLTFSTVMTTADTKQSSSTIWMLSRCPELITLIVFFSTERFKCYGFGLAYSCFFLRGVVSIFFLFWRLFSFGSL